MSNTNEILIKIKDATLHGQLTVNEIPITDIKELVITEAATILGNMSSDYIELKKLCNNFPNTCTDKNKIINFLDSLIAYTIKISDAALTNIIELPDNITPDDEYMYYLKLSEQYIHNKDQYYLCLENAAYHCKNLTEKEHILTQLDEINDNTDLNIQPTSIVIISYNNLYLTQKCVESIRNTCPVNSYEIIVVDNASSDNVINWLSQQPDINLICNNENMGFPKGCNIGIANSKQYNDIFLLNNDTRLTPNALFWLRMGLYNEENIGATGAICNYIGNQQFIDLFYTSISDYQRFGYVNNQYRTNSMELSTTLSGFAMLIKRNALNKTTLLDETLTPGYYEDDDICLQLMQLGYKLYVCHNSFIYHAGSQSFGKLKSDAITNIFICNQNYMFKKWGFHPDNNHLSKNIYDTFNNSKIIIHKHITLLEINAHTGATYAHLKYIYSDMNYIGLENNKNYLPCMLENVIYIDCSYDKYHYNIHNFNYVIINDSDNYSITQKEQLLTSIQPHLSSDAYVLWN